VRRIKWRWLIGLSAAFAIGYAAVAWLGLMPGLGWYRERQFTETLFGVGVPLGEPVFEFHTPRDFNGDGYSIEHFRLPAGVAMRFENPAELDGYPKMPEVRSSHGWQRSGWHRAGDWQTHSQYLSFALQGAPAEVQRTVRQALTRPKTWYAIQYKVASEKLPPNDLWILNVDLMVVDPEAGDLFLANLNT
jgi:hypothetical protein